MTSRGDLTLVFLAALRGSFQRPFYYATGGGVGISRAVAKTAALSLVMTVVINAVLTRVFWGTNPNLPIPT